MADEIAVYSPIGCPTLNVRLADETIWLTMQQLAMVFGVDRSVIGKHIRNVYKTGELAKEATWAKIAQVQVEGGRQVNRTLEYYNSDATADARGTAAPPHRFRRRRRAASQAVWKKVVVSSQGSVVRSQ